MKKLIIVLSLLVQIAAADPPVARVSDFADMGANSPALIVHQNDAKTFTWTLRNGSTFDGTGYTPLMYIALTDTASTCVTGLSAWMDASNGVFQTTWTPAQLSQTGKIIYAVGVISNGLATLSAQGVFLITADPKGN